MKQLSIHRYSEKSVEERIECYRPESQHSHSLCMLRVRSASISDESAFPILSESPHNVHKYRNPNTISQTLPLKTARVIIMQSSNYTACVINNHPSAKSPASLGLSQEIRRVFTTPDSSLPGQHPILTCLSVQMQSEESFPFPERPNKDQGPAPSNSPP